MSTSTRTRPTQDQLNAISEKLAKYGVLDSQENAHIFNPKDFIVLKNILIDNNGKIEEAIINSLFPPVKEETFFHYTKTEAALNILRDNKLRFYSILKRLNENELEEIDKYSIDPNYRNELASKYFYLSLTNTNLNEEEEKKFYSTFGDTRLTIRLKCSNIMCRKIHYSKKIFLLFHELNTLCQGFGYTGGFVVNQMSRFCAYYLPLDYGEEKETRALYINNFELVKKFCEEYKIPFDDIKKQFKEVKNPGSKNGYVEFELGKNDFGYLFEIKEIETPSDQISKFNGSGITIIPRKKSV